MPATSWYHFVAGSRAVEFATRWADEIAALLGPTSNGRRSRLAVDRLDPHEHDALIDLGVEVVSGQRVADLARMIKTPEEIVAIETAMAACDAGIADMREALTPGMTEQQLWAVLHRSNIEAGGEWFETRLLTSGPHTNPWYQECSDRIAEPGDLVAFDTDLIGIGGYSIDVSRTWIAGDADPTSRQIELYAAAFDQVHRNIELIRPGVSFCDLARDAHLPPGDLHTSTNATIAHGIGLCNEYPLIVNRDHFDAGGYDGCVEEGMVLCIESLVAPVGDREAVKLDERVLVTGHGARPLSSTPVRGPTRRTHGPPTHLVNPGREIDLPRGPSGARCRRRPIGRPRSAERIAWPRVPTDLTRRVRPRIDAGRPPYAGGGRVPVAGARSARTLGIDAR